MPDVTQSTGLFLLLALAVAAIVTVLVVLLLLKIWDLGPFRPRGSRFTASRTGWARPATMSEIIDSVSWPWRGTPREPEPPPSSSTAIVGAGRGHLLGQ